MNTNCEKVNKIMAAVIDSNITKENAIEVLRVKYDWLYPYITNAVWDDHYRLYLKSKAANQICRHCEEKPIVRGESLCEVCFLTVDEVEQFCCSCGKYDIWYNLGDADTPMCKCHPDFEGDREETLDTKCGCHIIINSRDHDECRCDDDGENWICADCYDGEYDAAKEQSENDASANIYDTTPCPCCDCGKIYPFCKCNDTTHCCCCKNPDEGLDGGCKCNCHIDEMTFEDLCEYVNDISGIDVSEGWGRDEIIAMIKEMNK